MAGPAHWERNPTLPALLGMFFLLEFDKEGNPSPFIVFGPNSALMFLDDVIGYKKPKPYSRARIFGS